jgi:acid stress-induced BolA-like protein IbaG/YrbA
MNGAGTVRNRLEDALRDSYDDIEMHFGPPGRPGRVSGVIVSAHFSGMDTDARQDQLWQVIREALGAESTDVSTIVTLTPEEYEDMTA